MGGISHITEKVYTDQKISPSSIVITPDKYRQMRRLAYTSGTKTEIFLKQARFMQDHTDCLEYKGEFKCFYPTYEDMTTQQLRGYFSWRTLARQGKYNPTSTSFIFVYIYELLNKIGVQSAQDAHGKLLELYNAYKDDVAVNKYLGIWIEDHAVYHGLEYNEQKDEQTKNAEILYYHHKYEPEDIFCAINALSSYDIKNSKIYSLYPEQSLFAVYYSYCGMCEHYQSIGEESFFMRLFGSVYTAPHEMFASSLFQREHHKDAQRDIGPFKSYVCKNGQWSITKIFTARSAKKNAAVFLKGIDHLLRKEFNVTPLLKNAELNSVRTRAVKKAIELAKERVRTQAQREAIRNIRIDVGSLDSIRRDADDVAKKLTVFEDDLQFAAEKDNESTKNEQMHNYANNGVYQKFSVAHQENIKQEDEQKLNQIVQQSKSAESNNLLNESKNEEELLDNVQKEYLYLLIKGEDARAMLRKKGIMQSVISESINQNLYDVFMDTVLDGEGNIIEDYLIQLKGIINYDDT